MGKKTEYCLDLDNDKFSRYLIRETQTGKVQWEKHILPHQIIYNGRTSDSNPVHVSRDCFGIFLSAVNRMAWEEKDPNSNVSKALKELWEFLESLGLSESNPQ